MGITAHIAEFATAFIDATGYASVYLLMVLESMIFPIPSEAVMPFAGFLVVTGRFTLWGVIVASTLGSITGSLLSYWIGAKGGEPFIRRFGKWFLIDMHELEITQRFFARRGEVAILVSRFIPVVRHLISIPAGAGRMRLLPFCIYTIIGAGLWNAFLAVAGMKLKENWEELMHYSHQIDIVVLGLLVALVGLYVYKHRAKLKAFRR